MASQRLSTVRSAAFRRSALSFENMRARPIDLDGIEIGAVRWEEPEFGVVALDDLPDGGALVTGQVVHDDDVAGPQGRREDVGEHSRGNF